MEYTELPAPPPLDQLIHCFWFLRGSSLGAAPQPIVSDGRIDLVLHLADPFARIDRDGTHRRQAHALLAGQMTGPIHVVPAGEADVVGIRLRTAAGAAFLPALLAEITNQVVALDEVEPTLASALFAAAARARTPERRAHALSTVLARFVRREPDAVLLHAVRAIDTPQPPRVRALADILGVSTRTLERRVVDGTGLTPVTLRKALRFRRAFNLLGHTTPGAWSRVALDAGYYDQAHLIRDFRQFAGSAPGEFFASSNELASAFGIVD